MLKNTDSISDSTVVNISSTITPIVSQGEEKTILIDSINASSCKMTVPDTKGNSFWLKDGQPSGWTQLFIAVGIPLFVVFLDKWITKCHTNKKEKRDRERYRKTVIDWISLITPIENSLSNSLSDLSNLIAQSDDMQPEFYAMPTTIPDKLGSLTVEQIMDAFLTDFKGDKDKCSVHIYNIISCLDFLSKTRNEIMKVYDAYNKQSVSYCEQWNTELSVFKEWKMQQGDAEIDRIVRLWAAGLICKKDSIQVHEKLVSDIFNMFGTSLDITPALIKMQNVIQQRRALSKGYSTVFANLSQKINLSLEQLSAACDYFGNHNLYKRTIIF